MICKKCKELGLKSDVIIPRDTWCTGEQKEQPYYDSDGNFHNHDAKLYSDVWECSNGHHWDNNFKLPCYIVDCDWNNTLLCHTSYWDDQSSNKSENT